MKKLTLTITVAAVLAAALVVLASPVSATRPEEVTFEMEMFFTGPDTAAGTFVATGAVNDGGDVTETFKMAGGEAAPRTVHGIKTLVSGQGTITIRFDQRIIAVSETEAELIGRFVILSGTGDYANLHGRGSAYLFANLDTMTLEDIRYSGVAHYDP